MRSDTNSGGNLEQGTVVEALRATEALCRERGVQLSPVRRAVLRVLWEAAQPMGAYDVIRALEQQVDRKLAPPTVYRALHFLLENRFISRIETQSAFTPCACPARPHTCVFLICDACGRSTEIENESAEALLDKDAAALGFRIGRRVIEMQGMCADCQSTGDDIR